MRSDRRTLGRATQFRATEDSGKRYIEGYFSVFDGVYELWSGATESIDPHAFDDTISGDIRALTNHDHTLVLGRTTANTLELRIDEKGLWGRIEVNPDDQDALNLYARVQRGDVNQCSFGFEILDETTDRKEDGTVHWTIRKLKLYEVSCCTFPAYESTSISARKREYEEIGKRRVEAWKTQTKERLKKWH